MAFDLTATATLLSQKTGIQPQIILELDGITEIFGAVQVLKSARFGDDIYFGDVGLVFGGGIADDNGRDYISLGGTTKNITQQLEQDRGGTGSVSSVKIQLIDKNEELTSLFTTNEPLGRKADVYVAFASGNHPDDSIRIFAGIVDSISFESGMCSLQIAHPESLKRQKLFQKVSSKLSGAINDSVTTITLTSTANMIVPADIHKTYINIDDELIEYSGISGNDLTGCVRGQLGTTAAAHTDQTETTTFHRLTDDALPLALKLMLSGGGAFGSNTATRFVSVSSLESVANAVFVPVENLQDKLGLTLGDLVTVSGSVSNDFTSKAILAFGTTDDGSYFVVDHSLVTEIGSSATITFQSQYDVLNEGGSLTPDQVDVSEHQNLNNLFGTSYHSYDFYINDDDISLKEFIEKQIYFPSGLYQLPRKGRASVGSTNPPLASQDTKTIGINEVRNPNKLAIKRSINKNFYNAVIYRFDVSALEEKYLSGDITQSATSTNLIRVGNRPLVIESKGIRSSAGANAKIVTQARKFLDRYKFGAEYIDVEVMWSTGFNLEVGDVVIFGDNDLQISDIKNGSRSFEPRLFEVTNKSLGITSGDIKLTLTDTAFSIDGKFVSLSPASLVDTGATTTRLPLKSSFGFSGLESDKWEQYIGQPITVHSPDYTNTSNSVITGFDTIETETMILSPALSFTPSEDDIVESIEYDSATDYWKKIHGYLTPSIAITSGASGTVFDVAAGDVGKFFLGSIVRVHNNDYTQDATETTVTDITGTTITVADDLGFTPTSSNSVDLVGFSSDEGEPYRLI